MAELQGRVPQLVLRAYCKRTAISSSPKSLIINNWSNRFRFSTEGGSVNRLREFNLYLLVAFSALSFLFALSGMRNARASVLGNCPGTQGSNDCPNTPCTIVSSRFEDVICAQSSTQGCCMYSRYEITCSKDVSGTRVACGTKFFDILDSTYPDRSCGHGIDGPNCLLVPPPDDGG